MKIIKSNVDLSDKKLIYKLTKSSGLLVQDAPEDLSIPVKWWALYDDPKTGKDGAEKENLVLSFIGEGGGKYSTISATFQREFLEIVEIMENDPFAILLKHGTAKNGKPFVTCELDCDF